MRCKWYYRDQATPDFGEIPAFRPKSTWTPPEGCPALELFLSQIEKELFHCVSNTTRIHNLSRDEWQVLKALIEDHSIIIKPADKGSCVVVWDREDYLMEGYSQLANEKVYTRVKNFSDETLSNLVQKSNKMFKELYHQGSISKDELKYLTYEYKNSGSLGRLYLLPKIHKRLFNVPGRPVISNCGTSTEKASEFLDHHLKSIMRAGKSYIRDTGHFLEKLKEIGEIPKNSLLVTADVTSLYPSIPHEDGLRALYIKLEERKDKKVSSENLIELAEFVLKNNYFEFNSEVYCQNSGTAMGTKFAPPYACIFMDMIETEFLEQQVEKPWTWFRYIDDIFFIWLEGEEKLLQFMSKLNGFHPNLKFTYEHSYTRVNFLDVTVENIGGSLITSLFCKPTDCHQYLHYASSHPAHTKRSIVYSQGLRIKKICSRENDFEQRLQELSSWLQNRAYPRWLIEREFERLKSRERDEIVETSKQAKKTGVPLTITFHPLLKDFGFVIRKYVQLLYLDSDARLVFSPPPFVAFRNGRNLKSYLVRAKVPPIIREKGCTKCKKSRCLTCKNIRETDTFVCSADGKQYKVNHKLNCDSKCVVYLLTCKVCKKQYVGQTTDKFRLRWNNYKACHKKAIGNEFYTQAFLHKHFLGLGHNGLISDCEITIIDKTDAAEPTSREAFWIEKLKTMYPSGLNISNAL